MRGRARRAVSRLSFPALLTAFHLLALAAPARADRRWTIPALREWTDAAGSYSFSAGTRIVVDPASANELSTTASVLSEDLLALTGLPIPVAVENGPQTGDIFLSLGATDAAIVEEGYLLTVADHIAISARTDAGVFYGTRSVLQMLRQGFEIRAGAARDWPDFGERALMVDVGRKYFSLAFLERHVKELAYLKLNYLHLHLSDNEGFRIESSSHPEIVSAQHHTKAEFADLIALAGNYHVMIVPEIDVPSHAAAVLAPHPDLELPGAWGKLDLSKAGSYALVGDLLNEYLALFPAPFWHTGADEYLSPADYASYPQLLSYARQRYGPAANAPDVYLGFVNWVDGIVKARGKQLRTWNDVYGVAGSTQTPNPDIILEMWWPFILPQNALANGHTIMNAEFFTLYYVLGGFAADAARLYESWAPNRQWVASVDASMGKPSYIDLPAATPGIRGGKFHVWCDSPDAQTEDQVQDAIFPSLRGVAQNSWGSPKLVPSYVTFTEIMDTIGHTPDWGPDFALMATSASAAVSAGQTATLSLRVAAIRGFNQQVTLSCWPVTPTSGMTCSVSPAAVTPAAGLSAPMASVSVGTTAGTSASPGQSTALAFGLLWIALAVPAAAAIKHKPLTIEAVLLAALLGGLATGVGCGSSSSSTPAPTSIPATQAGTYGVVVRASSGSVSHSVSMSVTVRTTAQQNPDSQGRRVLSTWRGERS